MNLGAYTPPTLQAVDDLIAAIDRIIDTWEEGDLAGAVREAEAVADQHRGLVSG